MDFDTRPHPEDVGVQSEMAFIKILPISGKISSDNTGRFPVILSRGEKYSMVMTDYDSDTILEEPLTSRTKADLLRSIIKLYNHIMNCDLWPHLYMLENERSSLTEDFIRKYGATHQLVPPDLHQDLIAESSNVQVPPDCRAFNLWSKLPPPHMVLDYSAGRNNIEPPATCPHEPHLSKEAYLNADFGFNLTPWHPQKHSDVSYLLVTKACSRAGGYHDLSDYIEYP